MISRSDLIEMAAGLVSEDFENPEYDRAISELIGSAFGVEGEPLDITAERIRGEVRAFRPASDGGLTMVDHVEEVLRRRFSQWGIYGTIASSDASEVTTHKQIAEEIILVIAEHGGIR